MNGIRSKFAARYFIIVAGFFCFCISSGCHSQTPNSNQSTSSIDNQEPTNLPLPDKQSGQIELNFMEFQQAKDMLAMFELTNNTKLPLFYESYSFTHNSEKHNFCYLAVKQTEKGIEGSVSDCQYAENRAMELLGSVESVLFAVPKWEVKTLLNLTSDKPEIVTKIGFKIFVGEERQEKIIWSDTIVFPKTL